MILVLGIAKWALLMCFCVMIVLEPIRQKVKVARELN